MNLILVLLHLTLTCRALNTCCRKYAAPLTCLLPRWLATGWSLLAVDLFTSRAPVVTSQWAVFYEPPALAWTWWRKTDLGAGSGVVERSLQGVAQAFGQILLQDQVQTVPAQLDGQNCEGRPVNVLV